MRNCLSGLALAAASTSPAVADTLYVATSGDDSNPGTLSAPFKTISQAASAATPGTTVYVRGGVYAGYVLIGGSGTAASRIVYSSYPGETAIIDGAGGDPGYELVYITGSYVDFQNFEVRNSADVGVAVSNAHDDVVSHCVVHGSNQAAVLVESDTLGQAHDNTIDSNTAYNNARANAARTLSGGWPTGIQTADSDRTTISNNNVYQNYGEGISVLRSRGGRVSGNVAYDNYSANVYLDNAPSAIVERNFLYATGDSGFLIKGKRSIAIMAALETYDSDNLPLSNVVVRNNITYATRYGFYYGAWDRPDGMQNALVVENTFVSATDADINIEYASASSGNALYGNIAYKVGGDLVEGSQHGWTFRYNCLYGGSAGGFSGVGNKVANPEFVGLGSLSPDGYKIKSGSACNSYVPRLSQTPTDFWGASRLNPTSAGAHQPAPSTTLSQPTSGSPWWRHSHINHEASLPLQP